MKRLVCVVFVAAVVFAGMYAEAQDMRWTTKVTEVIPQRGGRGGRGGGQQQPEQTREKTVTVIMRMSKSTVDGAEVLSFKHSQIKDQREEDAARAEIPWSDKEALTEGLKTAIADMKRPGQQSERKQVYKSADGGFAAKCILEGHSKSMEVTLQNAKKNNVDFTLPQQQVEVFFNLLRNMK